MPLYGQQQVIPPKIVVPPRALYRKAMAVPPAVTLSNVGTIATPLKWPFAKSIGSGTYVKVGQGFANVSAGNPVGYNSTTLADNILYNHTHSAVSTLITNSYITRFYHMGSELEFNGRQITGTLLCKINGEYVTLTPLSLTGNQPGFYYIPFGSVAERLIEFITYNYPVSGILTGQNDSVTYAPHTGPKCIIVGDSFAGGTGSNQVDSYPRIFAEALGWSDVWGAGVGGTGFLAGYTYRSRVASDVIPYNPDIVIFQLSVNDAAYTGAQIGAEADLIFAQVKSALPDCLIVATSVLNTGGVSEMSAAAWARCDAVKASVENIGGLFLNLMDMPRLDSTIALDNVLTINADAAAGATTIQVKGSIIPSELTTYKFDDGTRCRIKSIAGASSPFTLTLDAGLVTAQVADGLMTQAGDSLWTGTGQVGTVTGYGNSDLYVHTDGVHSSVAGHEAIGICMANLLIKAIGQVL